jgi:hypothetical protein
MAAINTSKNSNTNSNNFNANRIQAATIKKTENYTNIIHIEMNKSSKPITNNIKNRINVSGTITPTAETPALTEFKQHNKN